ncbi:MarR family winged helix-turn-helix transcriptional regulator [Nocardia gamkensis]|uniref:MarR family winged helix-turn-helix transcriptional regulator n=1 Tax=Nocardia gamkensis TaxID=352869 RepID=UPI0037C529B6
MNDVHNPGDGPVPDSGGFLYDPGVRASLGVFAGDDDTLALEAATAVRSASQAIDRLRAHGAGGRGLSSAGMDVLMRLSAATDEGLSVGELARAGGVSSRNITGLVDTLERDGLAQRVPDQRDRRSVRIRITSAGRDWLESFREPTQRAMSAVFQGFTADDLARFRHACLSLIENQRRIAQYLNQSDQTIS